MRRYLFPDREPPAVIRLAAMQDAAALAGLHGLAFAHGWPVTTFEAMLAEHNVFGHVAAGHAVHGFILSRRAADEAEILSVAVAAARRGAGLGRRLTEANLATLAFQRVKQVFLEVDSANGPAIALYKRLGFEQVGLRPGYYAAASGQRHDALIMRLDLKRFRAPAPVLDV